MNIIFHHPLPLDPQSKSASGIRPLRMLKAFKDLGCDVDLVVGYARDRNIAIKNVKEKIKQGKVYDFVYSENSTMPTALTEKNHFPISPFLDFNFFRFCRDNGVKVGLFYRDIYWKFPVYSKNQSFIKNKIANLFYRFDLFWYERSVDIIYLPSMEMCKYFPRNKFEFKALPPAHDIEFCVGSKKLEKNTLKMLYVGGLSVEYQLHLLCDVVCDFPQIEFTLCTREAEWHSEAGSYGLNYPSNIKVVHKSGDELRELYSKADVAVLFVNPHSCWEFSVPVKLFEYIGYKKPVIVTKGMLAGDYVEKNNIGWALPYERKSLEDFFNNYLAGEILLEEKIKSISSLSKENLWISRAKQVISDMK